MGHRTKSSGIIVTKSKKSKKSKPSHKFVIVANGKVFDRHIATEKGGHGFAIRNQSIGKDYEVVKVPYNAEKEDILKGYQKGSNRGFNRGIEILFPNAPIPKGKFEIVEKNPEHINKVAKVLKTKGHTVYKIKNHNNFILFRDSADKKDKDGKVINLGNV